MLFDLKLQHIISSITEHLSLISSTFDAVIGDTDDTDDTDVYILMKYGNIPTSTHY